MAISFTKLLNRQFNGAADHDAVSNVVKRTRVDARTVGYQMDDTAGTPTVEWRGMSPVPDTADQWRVISVQESLNRYLSQVSENERLVKIIDVTKDPMTFDEAIERLAVWELAKLMKEGKGPVQSQTADDLGHQHYRNLAMRRGFVVNTVGKLCPVYGAYPGQLGTFLKSDLEALHKQQSELRGDDLLEQLLEGKTTLEVTEEQSLEEDIQSFGEINLLNKMQFFAKTLVEYANVKLSYVEQFYANPGRISIGKGKGDSSSDLYNLMNNHQYFNPALVREFNDLRDEFADSIFRAFHVDEEDWDKQIDFNDPNLRRQLLTNPEARETYEFLHRDITFPLDEAEVEAMLFVSARALVYFREMLKDSPQKERLENHDLYKHSDVNDLLNFLDLVEIKHIYTELAKSAVILPQSQRYSDIEAQTEDFKGRVENLKENLRENGEFSPAHERQIDEFIKAKTPIYLLQRIRELPERIEKSYQFVADQILPRPFQMRLDLDYDDSFVAKPMASRRSGFTP